MKEFLKQLNPLLVLLCAVIGKGLCSGLDSQTAAVSVAIVAVLAFEKHLKSRNEDETKARDAKVEALDAKFNKLEDKFKSIDTKMGVQSMMKR